MKNYPAPAPRQKRLPAPRAKRRKPRDYLEWRTLRRWSELPEWEDSPPGYLLREARETAGVTQAELARRLGRSQQSIAQAERWASNPSAAFIRAWADALGLELKIAFVKARRDPDGIQDPGSGKGRTMEKDTGTIRSKSR